MLPSVSAGPSSPAPTPDGRPFPNRITAGCTRTAAALRGHAATAAREMERAEQQVERAVGSTTPTAEPTAPQRPALDAARRYRRAARERRAFDALAALHERHDAPAPLFTLRTRRHVRTVLTSDAYSQGVADALGSALRWTRGLPMPRRIGFEIMREAFDRLGLLDPVTLPPAIAQALEAAPPPAVPSGDSLSTAPEAVVVEVTAAPEPSTVEAFVVAVEEATAFEDGGGLVSHFRSIDFAEAFEFGLSVEAAIATVENWIIGCSVFSPRPFAWRPAPFHRDAAGRLREGDADDGPEESTGAVPEDGPKDGPAGGGESSHLPAPTPPVEPTDDELARADRLDAQADTAERRADHRRNLFAGQNLTRRRAAFRAAGAQEAERLTVFAAALRAVARAIRAGTLPPVLSGVRTRAHVERLVSVPSGPNDRPTTPRYVGGNALDRMGIDSAEAFEEAVTALDQLLDDHTDPDAEAKQHAADTDRLVEQARLARIPDYFHTPVAVIERIIQAAGLPTGPGTGLSILEPSAGDGAILDALRERCPDARLVAVEPVHRLHLILTRKGYSPFGRRFEHFEPSAPFDRIVMNPPFGRGGATAMRHVERAITILAPGGRVVAVVPESCYFRRDLAHAAFRALIDEHGGHWIDLPDGAFQEAGTGVKTRLTGTPRHPSRFALPRVC